LIQSNDNKQLSKFQRLKDY